MAKKFPFYRQLDQMDCGPTCLRMICKHYGKEYSLQYLRDITHQTRAGVSLHSISEAAEKIGFRTISVRVNYESLVKDVPLPCIAHWRQRHFVVVYKITEKTAWVADPAAGLMQLTREEFERGWISTQNDGSGEGILMALEPAPEFYDLPDPPPPRKLGLHFIWGYLRPYRGLLGQLVLGLLVGSLLQLVFPFLTQAVVDIGVGNRDIGFVYLVLLAQLVLFFSSTTINFLRSWILLHIGARLNIALLSDFLIKLTKMPIRFFESKLTGDLMQRMNDHYRIETFLTSYGLRTFFSIFNILIFGLVLAVYSLTIFTVFFIATFLFVTWAVYFIKKRKIIDYKQFDSLAANQNSIMELLSGMQEIKLQNSERRKRWEWERVQAQLFKVNVDRLKLEQMQGIGVNSINELKNILISFIAAKAVIDGDMTLGMMLSVQYIIGALNGPLMEFLGFMQMAQDAAISLERMSEIHNKEDETQEATHQSSHIPEKGDLQFHQVWFRYGDTASPWALKDITLTIPRGKVTAIVGSSGSGKTTLVKLLLRFYEPTQGTISIGNSALAGINNRYWRSHCGAVMQDGYIFSNSIADNIGVSDDFVDKEKLLRAVHAANIQSYIESLPLSYNTKIGQAGSGLSQGQRQRLLIARAVYKNPDFLFFDEATNALDAENERIIVQNLDYFFQQKTVIVVAHRLSTVKNADQIVVMEKGSIVEIGTHEELVARKGSYFHLIRNQLELGS